jgi:hypothetical protein
MTDAELIARLRLPWPKDGSGDEVTLPIWVLILTDEAADHIEALEAKLELAKKGLRKIIRTSDMHSAWDIAIATVEKLE